MADELKANGKKEVKPLPAIDSEFWQVGKYKADNAVHEARIISCMKRHIFTRRRLNEAECLSCPVGYQIASTDEVRDGHIYKEDVLLI